MVKVKRADDIEETRKKRDRGRKCRSASARDHMELFMNHAALFFSLCSLSSFLPPPPPSLHPSALESFWPFRLRRFSGIPLTRDGRLSGHFHVKWDVCR